MLQTYLVNWSGQPIPPVEMLVMRRVAVEMRTQYEAKEVGFVHDCCAGIVRFEKVGVYGAVGGFFFFGDFGSKNNEPNTVDFFIPRAALHTRPKDGMLIMQSMRLEGDTNVADGYAEDIDHTVGSGKIKITVRREV